jgi:hypothetical protein
MVLEYIRDRWLDWLVRIVALALLYVAPWEGIGKILLVLAFVALDRILSARVSSRRRAGERLLEWRVAKYKVPAPLAADVASAKVVFAAPTSFVNDASSPGSSGQL